MLSPLTEDTSMITVSSCGVKLQEVLSGLDKTLDIHVHVHFCQHSIISLSTWGVIIITICSNARMHKEQLLI